MELRSDAFVETLVDYLETARVELFKHRLSWLNDGPYGREHVLADLADLPTLHELPLDPRNYLLFLL